MDTPDRAGRLPIHYTAVDDKPQELRELIASGENINVQEGQGWTPLHFAAHWGSLDIANILLESGADVSIVNHAGYTPLDLAVVSSKPNTGEVAKAIFLHGGDPHHKNHRGNDSMRFLEMLSPDSDRKELLGFFREHGVE